MFYSQILDRRTNANVCVRCETTFIHWSDYHTHVVTNICIKKILPVRTSSRTKAQIVHDMEKTWAHAVIPSVKPWHETKGELV